MNGKRSITSARSYHWLALLLLMSLGSAIGCGGADIATTYGQRRGAAGGPSVNGTAVFSGMFEEAGHRVITWRRLSPKLEQADTIVWFPDDFQPPTLEQRQFLENWLDGQSGRTVIYVGRDYDAETDYWRQLQAVAPPDQVMEVTRRMATARAVHDAARARMPDAEAADWFTLWRDEPHRQVKTIEGPWSADIDVDDTKIELNARLGIPSESEQQAWHDRDAYLDRDRPEFTRLLSSKGEPLVTRVTIDDWQNSKLILVTNGSFLLNLPLINHEHRKLAGKLVSECSPGRVVFLESGYGGPTVFDQEPDTQMPTGFAAFTVWPIGFILIHGAVWGILLCVALYPIFGRARGKADSQDTMAVALGSMGLAGIHASSSAPASVVKANFGKHIDALGELLELSQDRQYARDRVTYYHEHVKRDSGASHRQK